MRNLKAGRLIGFSYFVAKLTECINVGRGRIADYYQKGTTMSDTAGIRKLYKSRTERMIDGVCGGVAKYFTLDPTLVRIAWVLLTLFGGSGIILYIVAMVVMPKEPYVIPDFGAEHSKSAAHTPADQSQKNSLFWGILLIFVGALLFMHNMGVSLWHEWWSLDWDLGLAVLLILVGVGFLWGGRNSLVRSTASPEGATTDANAEAPEQAAVPDKLYRSFTDNKMFGVCGGLGEYFGIDSTIIRILFIVGAFLSSGIVVIGYIIMAIVVPKANPVFKTV